MRSMILRAFGKTVKQAAGGGAGGPVTISAGPTESPNLNGASINWDLTGVDAGDSLVVPILWGSASVTITSVTCSGESNLTGHTQKGPVGPSDSTTQIFHLDNVTSGGTKTITINFSGAPGGGTAFAMALAGGKTSGFFDAEPSGGGSNAASGTPSTSITTTVANAFIVAICSNDGGDPQNGTDYTLVTLADRNWFINGEYDLDAGAAGAKTVDMTVGGVWVIGAAAFKPA
jgi:hypothetical protein